MPKVANKTKGLIGIDIDGTLTAVRNELSKNVVDYLHSIVKEGWKLLFVTGRTLDWSIKLLEALPFDFYLSVYNGAYTIEYPAKNEIKKSFLPFERAFQVVNLVQDEDVGIAFYGPPDRKNRSFLYRKFASHVLVNHLLARGKVVCENWVEIDSVMDLPVDSFASMRLFCLPHTAKKLGHLIENKTRLHAPMMKDSYSDAFSVVQVTHADVSKGEALATVLKHIGRATHVIACGDDYNDISMLKRADVAVVMASAPSDVLALADVVAPPAKEDGLIQGITHAIKRLGADVC